MAIAGKAKTRLEDGQRLDIVTGQPYGNPMQKPEPLKPITINDLNEAPSPMELVQPRASTATTGALASIGASADQFNERVKQQREEALARESSSLTSYTSAVENQLTQSGAQSDLYGQKGGVDDIQSELDTINNQLLQEQVALQRQIEGIDKNSEGMLRSQVEAEKRRVETESLRRQADLSVIQMGIQGRFDSAKAVADRAVDAIMERQKNELEALKLTYERNKERFDETDRRAFEVAVNDRERVLNAEETRLKEINNVALTYLQEGGNPATAQQIMGAKTVAEAVGMTGGVIGRNARIQNAINQAKYDEMQNALLNPDVLDAETREAIGKSEITQKAVSRISLVKNLAELRSLIQEYGTKNIIDQEAAGKINSLRSQLEIDIAVAGGQGAISGEEATRYSNIVGSGWTDRQSKVLSQIDQAVSTNNGKIKSDINLLSSTYKGAANFEPFKEFLDDFELQELLDKELKQVSPQEQKATAIENWLLGSKSLTQ